MSLPRWMIQSLALIFPSASGARSIVARNQRPERHRRLTYEQLEDKALMAQISLWVQESVAEGMTVPVQISLDQPATEDITIFYQTSDGSATVADNDYAPFTGGTLIMSAGTSMADLTIPTTSDSNSEGNETFHFALTGAINAELPTSADREIVIQDQECFCGGVTDPATVSISSVNAVQSEGDAGNTAFTFRLTLTGSAPGGFDLRYITEALTALQESAGNKPRDYFGHDTVLHFAGTAGETRDITVNVVGDNIVERDEMFSVQITEVTPVDPGTEVTIGQGVAPATIMNDDEAYAFISTPAAVTETPGTTVFQTYIVELTAPVELTELDEALAVHYSLADISTTSADYNDLNGGVRAFNSAANPIAAIAIVIPDDYVVELDEEYKLTITNIAAGGLPVYPANQMPNNPNGLSAWANGQILNDDVAILQLRATYSSVPINNLGGPVIVHEDAGTLTLIAYVTKPVDHDVSFRFATSESTLTPQAIAGTDYTSVNDIFQIPAGSQEIGLQIPIADNSAYGLSRYFAFAIVPGTLVSGEREVSPGAVSGDAKIVNDDASRIILGIHSSGVPGETPGFDENWEFVNGHVWLSVYDEAAADTTYYGLYPSTDILQYGTNPDSDVIVEQDGGDGLHNRYYLLDQGEHDAANAFLNTNATWSPTYNCADWAIDGVEQVRGESIDATYSLVPPSVYSVISTPHKASESIVELESERATTRQDPLP